MKIKSSVLFLLSSVFLASCDVWAAEDPLAGEPEGERIALWPEGKVPGVVQMGRVLTVRRQAGSARVSIRVSFERQLRWMSVPRAVVRVDHSRQGVDPALL